MKNKGFLGIGRKLCFALLYFALLWTVLVTFEVAVNRLEVDMK